MREVSVFLGKRSLFCAINILSGAMFMLHLLNAPDVSSNRSENAN